jgi:hypothetical protein
MPHGLWLADAPAYPLRQCVGRAVRRKHARLMDLRRRAFAACELHLGDRDEHFGARLEVGGFQQRLLFPRAIGAQHRQAVDQRLIGGILDVVPVDFEFIGLREFAQSGEQACAVDGALALAFVKVGRKLSKIDAGLTIEGRRGRFANDAKSRHARQSNETPTVAGFGKLRDAAGAANSA